ncbi:MAG: hypothetical protein MJZ64_00200 [Paludibacteraceae bacterium]|nr:hypothetical protein [Paludibacteraceae bacterium]
MKKILLTIITFVFILLLGSCENKYEFGYIDSLEGTAWQSAKGKSESIYEFKSNHQLIWKTSSQTYTDLTWYCSDNGDVSIYWSKFIGSGEYSKGQFDKYKGTLTIDGDPYKLISK